MNRNFTVLAAAAAIAFAAPTGAFANEWLIGTGSYVTGSGENQSVAASTPRAAHPLSPVVVTGSGENVSVEIVTPPVVQPQRYIAVIEGSGENLSVRHIPLPRG